MTVLTPAPLLDRFRSTNPFLDNRINGPLMPERDVPELHHSATTRLQNLARQAMESGVGLGAVLWGEAGVGKSHVLARLGRWAEQGNARLVYLHNIQAAPDALPRTLLGALIGRLTEGRRDRLHRTPLYAILKTAVLQTLDGTRATRPEIERRYSDWLDSLGPEGGDRRVHEIFLRLFLSATLAQLGKEDGRLATIAVRWLSGGMLDALEARLLDLPVNNEGMAQVGHEDARQVIMALSRLVLCEKRPLILALDQVDNLDDLQVQALSRYLQAILDTAKNLLLITAGVHAPFERWRVERVIQLSAWDRLTQFQVVLRRLAPEEAEPILYNRLDAFFAPYADLEPLRRVRERDPLFPLGQLWARRTLHDYKEIRPRELINLARVAWEREQARAEELNGDWLVQWRPEPSHTEPPSPPPPPQTEVIDHAVEVAIQDILTELRADPAALPVSPDHLEEVLAGLLGQCQGLDRGYGLIRAERVPALRHRPKPTYHLSLIREEQGKQGETGVVIVAVDSAMLVTGFLGRLRDGFGSLKRAIVVSDARTGLPLGERGEEHLTWLRTRGDAFAVFELPLEQLQMLEALYQVVNRAGSGEIELPSGEKVSEAEVIASHHRRGRYRSQPLLRLLLG